MRRSVAKLGSVSLVLTGNKECDNMEKYNEKVSYEKASKNSSRTHWSRGQHREMDGQGAGGLAVD